MLVRDIKSRVYGSANLSVIMHQYSLSTFGTMFGLIPPGKTPATAESQFAGYGETYAFLGHPKSAPYRLTRLQLDHLRQHYLTVYPEILDSLRHPDLIDMDPHVKIWYRCRVEKTVYHCEKYRRTNSTRLNHLVCVEQEVDANARFRSGTREEEMIRQRFYAYVQFYCIHTFHEKTHMLMYSSYRRTVEHHGLVEDHGRRHEGFQDIHVLEHLCARVTRQDGKVFFVDTQDVMEERLRAVLG